jgi:hypothetical protein
VPDPGRVGTETRVLSSCCTNTLRKGQTNSDNSSIDLQNRTVTFTRDLHAVLPRPPPIYQYCSSLTALLAATRSPTLNTATPFRALHATTPPPILYLTMSSPLLVSTPSPILLAAASSPLLAASPSPTLHVADLFAVIRSSATRSHGLLATTLTPTPLAAIPSPTLFAAPLPLS